jgi:hypothetical protein
LKPEHGFAAPKSNWTSLPRPADWTCSTVQHQPRGRHLYLFLRRPSATAADIYYMSKRFFGRSPSSSSLAPPSGPAPATTKTTPGSVKEKSQVSLLYELGLLDDSDKRPRRRTKDKDREVPGRTGSHPKKGTQPTMPILTYPSPLHLRNYLLIRISITFTDASSR